MPRGFRISFCEGLFEECQFLITHAFYFSLCKFLMEEKSRRPYDDESVGRSDLGGEQTWRPEHKGMSAAPKKLSVRKSLYG
jgi:hypothetical protein